MAKVLVTGGAGFIGSEIVNQLNQMDGWHVTVIDGMSEQIHGKEWTMSYLFNSIKGKCEFIKSDIRNFDAVSRVVEGQDYIIHLASETGTGQSMYQINQYNDVNIMGTSNILQALSLQKINHSVKKIILASSRSVYGEGKYLCPKCGEVFPTARHRENLEAGDFNSYCDNCGLKLSLVPTNEDSAIHPISLYAYTKYAQEKMLETMCPVLGLDYTIFRFQNVYGVGQSLKNPYTGILSIFSTLMLEDKPINIFEDGNESRDFINVSDIASAVITSLKCEASDSEIFNLGSGKATSVIEIANLLRKKYQSNSRINITGDFRIGDIAHCVADISKAKEILGFQPKVSLSKGLDDFCNWVRKQDFDNSGYEKSLDELAKESLLFRK
jgi:dTDP-L-rhamnose 4-epimerase